jgi:hypothetical protein
MTHEEQHPKNQNFKSDENQNTLKVEIVSNWSFLEILGDRKKVSKIIASLLILVVTIFIGLAFVTISIKRIYPYNDIKINSSGAITMQNENIEIIYWLFNTADLWSNSGIKVKKDDVLTIRASGKFHTAIHHLVKDTRSNKKLDDNWVGTDGDGKNNISTRDSLRKQYRIFADKAQDALIMQVIPENIDKNSEEFEKYLSFTDGNNKDNFHFIGKERIDLRIHNNGILHFAVNDIVLTENVINKMIAENNSLIDKYAANHPKDTVWVKLNDKFFKFGKYPCYVTATKDTNEMIYYREKKYYNAWYDDNVGSFLIVIERKKSQ